MKFYDQVKASADFADGSVRSIAMVQVGVLEANQRSEQYLKGWIAGSACALVISVNSLNAYSGVPPKISPTITTIIADEVLEHVRRRLAELTAARN